MSASKKKKVRQELAPEQLAELQQKQQQEEQAAKRSKLVYTIVGIASVLLVAFLLVWNTGLIQRNATAVTVKDKSYSTGDAQYFFNTSVQNVYLSYYQMLGMAPFNTTASLKTQVYSSEQDQSWYDYMLSQALNSMSTYTAIADQAKADGYTLSAEAQAHLNSSIADLGTVWKDAGFSSEKEYVQANYGPYMTSDRLIQLFTMNVTAEDYANAVTAGFSYDKADYEAYYKENTDSLDTFTLSQFTVQAKVATTDDQGKVIEMSDEEKAAALEAAKADAKALAEEIQAKLEAGEDSEAIQKEYGDRLFDASIDAVTTGSGVSSTYSEWAFDSARKNGDVTLAEYGTSAVHYYYIVRLENRERDDDPTAAVRHILIQPEKDEGAATATDAQKATAKAKAEELLAQWKAGEATEESFSALAVEHSSDTTADNGGLISGISPHSNYVESFRDWSVDSSRKAGDTDIVESSFGYHVMYYVADGDPVWMLTADLTLRNQDYLAWEEDICAGYEAVPGFGLKFVEG